MAATGAAGGLALGGTAIAQQDGNGNGNGNGDDEDENGGEGRGRGGRTFSYRVTVTNLTDYQPFTPPAVALHQPSVEVFAVGDPANTPTKEIAENGNLGPLVELINDNPQAIGGSAVGDGPLVPSNDPGDTGRPYFAELHVEAGAQTRYLSFIAMLIATNDGFVGLDTVPLPLQRNGSVTYFAQGYDAGTEVNTEEFADIVPPAQGLTGENREGVSGTAESDPELAEDGVITPHPGITGVGDVPEKFGWSEPAASLTVERID
jgi:hypothetical protein